MERFFVKTRHLFPYRLTQSAHLCYNFDITVCGYRCARYHKIRLRTRQPDFDFGGEMLDHLKVLFSSQAWKAWVAGLVGALALWLGPLITDWVAVLTPDAVSGWFAGMGINISIGVAGLITGAIGVVWTYITKNKPPSIEA
jgi:hypothetical protein